MLFPLLEGRNFITIAGVEGGKILAHPDFRFFATQNPASFAVMHTNILLQLFFLFGYRFFNAIS